MSDGGSSAEGGGRKKTVNSSLSLVEDYGCSDSDSADEGRGAEADGGGEAELSEMVLKNNIINACAHGPLQMETAEEETEAEGESRHIIIDSSGGGVIEYSVAEYRERDTDDSVSSDSASDVNSVKDAEELSSSAEEDSLEREEVRATARGAPRVRGELALDDLPPIEELSISVPPHQTSPIGKVFNIIDKLVIVQALPETPAVDLDSVLFLDKGQRALGKVFDVFGPVTEPHYCVRFNSAEQIRERSVERGMDVYIAPQTNHTNYVFVSELMKIKGSDASWLNDIEPPPSQVEYSDDEDERRASRARREARREPAPGAPPAPPAHHPHTHAAPTAPHHHHQTNRRPKPTRFEEQMNRKNLQRTAEANSRFGSAGYRFLNPFGGMPRRPPAPAPQPRWGGTWPAPDEPPTCPPFMLARPVFNPYGPPGFNMHPSSPYGTDWGRGRGWRAPPAPGFGPVRPWVTQPPRPPPPNT